MTTRDNETTYKFGFNVPTATPEKIDEWFVYVNPYQAKLTGKQLIKTADEILPHPLIPFVFRLHFALLAEETGGIIVGIMGVILVFSVLTGLIVWWPLTGHWRRALSIKRHSSTERLNHDLHQTFGFYTFPILLAVLLSGVYMNLPDQFMAVVKQLSPGTQGFMDSPHSIPIAELKPISLGRALAIVQNRYPEGRLDWISPADSDTGVYVFSISDVPKLSPFWSERQISIDQYSGAILAVRDPSTRPTAGQTFVDWQWPLHSGKAFGWPGRILVFISGLACPVLFVTGVIRWFQKRRAKNNKPKRSKQRLNPQ